jgi:hypothetical protein
MPKNHTVAKKNFISFKQRMLMLTIVVLSLFLAANIVHLPLAQIAEAGAGNTTVAPKTVTMNITYYGFADNNPPSAIISNGTVHTQAGGTGTYADPMTGASNVGLPGNPGTRFYVTGLKKYVMYEDHEGTNPNENHLDIWIPSDASSGDAVVQCENNQPFNGMQPVIQDPPANEPVDTTPMFNVTTKQCNTNTGKTATAGGGATATGSATTNTTTSVAPSFVCAGSTSGICPSPSGGSSGGSSSSSSSGGGSSSSSSGGSSSSSSSSGGGSSSGTSTATGSGFNTGGSGGLSGLGGGGDIGGLSSIFLLLLIILFSIL